MGGWTWIDWNRQMGISWEFRGKNLELLVLMLKYLQFYLGTSWELRGNNLGKNQCFLTKC